MNSFKSCVLIAPLGWIVVGWVDATVHTPTAARQPTAYATTSAPVPSMSDRAQQPSARAPEGFGAPVDPSSDDELERVLGY